MNNPKVRVRFFKSTFSSMATKLRMHFPSTFSSIAIELKVQRDWVSSIAIELNLVPRELDLKHTIAVSMPHNRDKKHVFLNTIICSEK